jgi:aspartyl/asparaginyl beta-hydroxylase (cupin superfamily)
MFYQKFFKRDEIDFDNLGDQVGVEAVSISMIKQPPGMVNPMHRDTFYQINKKFPNDSRVKVRANIQLLDWKAGHFLQFNDTVVTHWKANTGYMWDSDVLHLAANAGLEDRYSLQISGFLKLNG